MNNNCGRIRGEIKPTWTKNGQRFLDDLTLHDSSEQDISNKKKTELSITPVT